MFPHSATQRSRNLRRGSSSASADGGHRGDRWRATSASVVADSASATATPRPGANGVARGVLSAPGGIPSGRCDVSL